MVLANRFPTTTSTLFCGLVGVLPCDNGAKAGHGARKARTLSVISGPEREHFESTRFTGPRAFFLH